MLRTFCEVFLLMRTIRVSQEKQEKFLFLIIVLLSIHSIMIMLYFNDILTKQNRKIYESFVKKYLLLKFTKRYAHLKFTNLILKKSSHLLSSD